MKYHTGDNTCMLFTARNVIVNAGAGTTGFHLTAARKEDTECRLCGSGTCFVTSASIHPRFLLRVTETQPKKIVNDSFYDVHTSLALMCRYTSVAVNLTELKIKRRSHILVTCVLLNARAAIAQYSDGLRAGRPGSIPGRDKRFLPTPQRPDRLWGPPSLLSQE
jgi:hypothetical protein